jgi:hypothetical protein
MDMQPGGGRSDRDSRQTVVREIHQFRPRSASTTPARHRGQALRAPEAELGELRTSSRDARSGIRTRDVNAFV